MSFGTYLKSFRLNKGLTQSELAEFAGVSVPYISKLEHGKLDPPSEEVCQKIALALNIDPYRFIVDAGKMPTDFYNVISKDPDVFQYLKRKVKAHAEGSH